MTKRPLTNVAASVRARLLDRSRETREDFQFLLQRYAAERFSIALASPPTATATSSRAPCSSRSGAGRSTGPRAISISPVTAAARR